MHILKRTSVLFFIALLLFVCSAKSSYAQDPTSVKLPLRLAWNENKEGDLNHYRVYYGTASRDYNEQPIVAPDQSRPYAVLDSKNLSSGKTYFIALTAVDDAGNESGFSSELAVFVEPFLNNGASISGRINPGEEQLFEIDLPPNQTSLEVALTGNNDADLYIKYGSPPTSSNWDCRPYTDNANETCTITNPSSGTWYILVRGYSEVVDYELVATFFSGGSIELEYEESYSETVYRGEQQHFYIDLPAGESDLVVALSGNNDADLYVKYGSPPTTSDWDCRPYRETSNEICSFNNPSSGRWHIMVRGYSGTVSYQLLVSRMKPLQSGMPQSSVLERGKEDFYFISLPPNQDNLEVKITGNNDADLYVRFGSPPNTSEWDCRPYTGDSNETCTFGNPADGMWYVMVRGYAPLSDYQVTVTYSGKPKTTSPRSSSPSVPRFPTAPSIPVDGMTPGGTVLINNGDEITNSQRVTLFLSVEGINSATAQMCFSNDNNTWSTPEPLHSTKAWTLSPGNGTKTVYAKFSNEAGNWMDEPISDSIELQINCPKPMQLDAAAIASSGAPLPVCSEDKMVDGKTGSGWLSPLRSNHQDEHITLDLGELKVINRIDICSNPLLLLNLFPRDFKVQGSLDKENWVDLFTVTDYSPPLSHTNSWSFDNTEVRYLQVIATRTRQFLFFFYAAYIAELKVFGCAEPVMETTERLSTQTLSQAGTGVGELTPDTQKQEKRQMQPRDATPGRPGKPVFIFNNNP